MLTICNKALYESKNMSDVKEMISEEMAKVISTPQNGSRNIFLTGRKYTLFLIKYTIISYK